MQGIERTQPCQHADKDTRQGNRCANVASSACEQLTPAVAAPHGSNLVREAGTAVLHKGQTCLFLADAATGQLLLHLHDSEGEGPFAPS